MIIGYAKVQSPSNPATIDQVRQDLITAGAELVYIDCNTMWHANQPQHGLDTALAECARGDTLLTLTPARLAGSVGELIAIANRLTEQGAALRVLQIAGNQTLDTATPVGAMMLGALGLMAAFDRGTSTEPTHGGTDAAMMAMENTLPRRPRGRPPTASTQATEIVKLRAAGMRAIEIADRLKICRASVYRVLNLGNPGYEAAPMVQPVATV
jgi:DNA invertase Pin-like site-specific DNA recombinase